MKRNFKPVEELTAAELESQAAAAEDLVAVLEELLADYRPRLAALQEAQRQAGADVVAVVEEMLRK